jgi:hypothetical protein
MSLPIREKRVRIIAGKRKKYIEKNLIPQIGFFNKINNAMLWIEKVLRKK